MAGEREGRVISETIVGQEPHGHQEVLQPLLGPGPVTLTLGTGGQDPLGHKSEGERSPESWPYFKEALKKVHGSKLF